MTQSQLRAKSVCEGFALLKRSALSQNHTVILLHAHYTREGVFAVDHSVLGFPSSRTLASELSRLKSFGYLYKVEDKKYNAVYKLSVMGETYVEKLLK